MNILKNLWIRQQLTWHNALFCKNNNINCIDDKNTIHWITLLEDYTNCCSQIGKTVWLIIYTYSHISDKPMAELSQKMTTMPITARQMKITLPNRSHKRLKKCIKQ